MLLKLELKILPTLVQNQGFASIFYFFLRMDLYDMEIILEIELMRMMVNTLITFLSTIFKCDSQR